MIDRGGSDGVGRRVRFHSRGRLPYTLRWTAETTAVSRPDRIAVRASGDFEGAGEWTIHAVDASHTEATYVWAITATRPLLKYLSPLFRPLFEWNHRWAMTVLDVVACNTVNAARMFPVFKGRGTLAVGAPADVTILELRDGSFQFLDNYENTITGRQRLFVTGTILAGKRIS